jgi:hypothetical protein
MYGAVPLTKNVRGCPINKKMYGVVPLTKKCTKMYKNGGRRD